MMGADRAAPELHLIVGSNGAGKSTYFERVLFPATGLPFINADLIAERKWPDDAEARSYDAARIAERTRQAMIEQRRSFVGETVFSHPSKLELLRQAKAAGYRVTLHVILVPEDLAVARVMARVQAGGHPVPEDKIRQRYRRLWAHVVDALNIVDEVEIFDNSRADRPYLPVAEYLNGRAVRSPNWPPWTPTDLTQ